MGSKSVEYIMTVAINPLSKVEIIGGSCIPLDDLRSSLEQSLQPQDSVSTNFLSYSLSDMILSIKILHPLNRPLASSIM